MEVWRDEDYQNSNIDKSWVAYSETGADDAGGLDCRLRKKGDGSFGVRLGTDRGEVVLVHVDEDITLVSSCRFMCIPCVCITDLSCGRSSTTEGMKCFRRAEASFIPRSFPTHVYAETYTKQ